MGVPTTSSRQELGKQGEEVAAKELARRGYAILARRYRTRFGEIDIIAKDDEVVVFVEVKARRSPRYGGALEAVPSWKQRRIAAMALDYLARTKRLNDPCRFDVVAIDGLGTDRMDVQIVRDAFSSNR
jgi:putative endonuclease